MIGDEVIPIITGTKKDHIIWHSNMKNILIVNDYICVEYDKIYIWKYPNVSNGLESHRGIRGLAHKLSSLIKMIPELLWEFNQDYEYKTTCKYIKDDMLFVVSSDSILNVYTIQNKQKINSFNLKNYVDLYEKRQLIKKILVNSHNDVIILLKNISNNSEKVRVLLLHLILE